MSGRMILGSVVGILVLGCGTYKNTKATTDRKKRVYTLTEVVAESEQKWTAAGDCVQVFTLEFSSFSFESECKNFVICMVDGVSYPNGHPDGCTEFVYQPPRVGDVVSVSYSRSNDDYAEEEVLRVYNLTQEIERVKCGNFPPETPTPTQ